MMLTVKLTKTRLADPQDTAIESHRVPGMLGVRDPESAQVDCEHDLPA